MNNALTAVFGSLTFTLACLIASPVAAGQPYYAPTAPTYVILVPANAHAHSSSSGVHAYGMGVTAPSYAYGWFGVAPRSHWSRHHGYYGIYTQWMAR